MVTEGLRSSVGVAAPPFTKGPYTWSETLSFSIDSLPAGDSYSGVRSVVACPTGYYNSYGAASYFETDITGTQGGEFMYGSGSWINLLTGTVGAGKYLCAQDNGIYEEAAATITNAMIVFGLRCELIVSDTDAKMFPFSINTGNVPITALIDCNNITDLGTTAVSKTTTSTYLPIARDIAGNLRYVLLYS